MTFSDPNGGMKRESNPTNLSTDISPRYYQFANQNYHKSSSSVYNNLSKIPSQFVQNAVQENKHSVSLKEMNQISSYAKNFSKRQASYAKHSDSNNEEFTFPANYNNVHIDADVELLRRFNSATDTDSKLKMLRIVCNYIRLPLKSSLGKHSEYSHKSDYLKFPRRSKSLMIRNSPLQNQQLAIGNLTSMTTYSHEKCYDQDSLSKKSYSNPLSNRDLDEITNSLSEITIKDRNHNKTVNRLLKNKYLFRLISEYMKYDDIDVKLQTIRLLQEIIPLIKRSNSNLDSKMAIVLPQLFNDYLLDKQTVLIRSSLQTIHIYMRSNNCISRLLESFLTKGIENENQIISKNVIVGLPVLLTHQFSNCNLRHIVKSLLIKLYTVTNSEFPFEIKDEFVKCINVTLNQIKKIAGTTRYVSEYINESVVGRDLYKSYKKFVDVNENPKSPNDGLEKTLIICSNSPNIQIGEINSKNSLEYGILPNEILTRLFSEDASTRYRLQAGEDLVSFVNEYSDLLKCLKYFGNLTQLLSTLCAGNHCYISIGLRLIEIIVRRLGSKLKRHFQKLTKIVLSKVGSSKHQLIKQNVASSLVELLRCSPKLVMEELLCLLYYDDLKIRQECINLVIIGLLRFPSTHFDLERICYHIIPSLNDSKRNVRQATLECITILNMCMGNSGLMTIKENIKSMGFETGSVVVTLMEAVHARLSRRQCPRINSNGLVEYALDISTRKDEKISYAADVEWVLSGPELFNKNYECVSSASNATSIYSTVNTKSVSNYDSTDCESVYLSSQSVSNVGDNDSAYVSPVVQAPGPRSSAKAISRLPNDWDFAPTSENEEQTFSEEKLFSDSDSYHKKFLKKYHYIKKKNDAEINYDLDHDVSWADDSFHEPSVDWDKYNSDAINILPIETKLDLNVMKKKSEKSKIVKFHYKPNTCIEDTSLDEYNDEIFDSLRTIRNSANKKKTILFEKNRGMKQDEINDEILTIHDANSDCLTLMEKPYVKTQTIDFQPLNGVTFRDSPLSGDVAKVKIIGKGYKKTYLKNVMTKNSKFKYCDNFQFIHKEKLNHFKGTDVMISSSSSSVSTLVDDSEKTNKPIVRPKLKINKKSIKLIGVKNKLQFDQHTTKKINFDNTYDGSKSYLSVKNENMKKYKSTLDISKKISTKCNKLNKKICTNLASSSQVNKVTIYKTASQFYDNLEKSSSFPLNMENIIRMSPVQDPGVMILKSLALLESDEWDKKCNGMQTIQRLCKNNPKIILANLSKVMSLLYRESKNLRSQVSRMSLNTVSFVFQSIGRSMDKFIDMSIDVSLSKYGLTNQFLRNDASQCLRMIINHANQTKASLALINIGLSHRNGTIRSAASYFLVECIDMIDMEKIMNYSQTKPGNQEIAERFVLAIAKFSTDTLPTTRYNGQKILFKIMHNDAFHKIAKKCLSSRLYSDIKIKIEHLSTKGMPKAPNANEITIRSNSYVNINQRCSDTKPDATKYDSSMRFKNGQLDFSTTNFALLSMSYIKRNLMDVYETHRNSEEARQIFLNNWKHILLCLTEDNVIINSKVKLATYFSMNYFIQIVLSANKVKSQKLPCQEYQEPFHTILQKIMACVVCSINLNEDKLLTDVQKQSIKLLDFIHCNIDKYYFIHNICIVLKSENYIIQHPIVFEKIIDNLKSLDKLKMISCVENEVKPMILNGIDYIVADKKDLQIGISNIKSFTSKIDELIQNDNIQSVRNLLKKKYYNSYILSQIL
ncbi:hypothetical protein A3Q56_03438 [Intoshia linei]|uniref:TOG domain-containing protein n=1 Tax=Intoshia linei TaxID=1819745 RepID=A0A177B3G3_9BILA|nr:hypothetical protein A3Q56_03438 [Intoshia linei]